jgi:hypothetical protein
MDKQQTAVEWLINELHKTRDYQRVINEANQSSTSVRDVIDQAKEMEKEKLEDAWIAALDFGIEKMKGLNTLESKDAFEKFYKTTYGGNK